MQPYVPKKLCSYRNITYSTKLKLRGVYKPVGFYDETGSSGRGVKKTKHCTAEKACKVKKFDDAYIKDLEKKLVK
jgi:hypothetical protein